MSSSGVLRPARLALATIAGTLAAGFVLATPAAAHVSTDPTVYGWTTGRLIGSVGALVALAGVVIGGLALARPTSRIGTSTGRLGATMAIGSALVGIVLGGIVIAVAKGGPGTGYGIVGGYAAIAIGLIALVLGWLAQTRSRRTN